MDLLAHLDAFVAVAERRSFSTAAEQLHVAQPLLSRRIKNLERRLGGELFHRSQRGVEITELGQLLLPHAEDIIARTRHLLTLAESAQQTTSITIGIPPECDPSSLARLIRDAAQRDVLITVQESPARDRAGAFEEGRLDCALLRVPVDGAAFVVTLGLAPVTRAGSAGGVIHLDSLRPRRRASPRPRIRLLVLPEDDIPEHTDRLARALAGAGVSERCLATVSSPATAVAEVLAGAGQLICDERFARRHGLAWAPLANPDLHRGYELAANAGRLHGRSPHTVQTWLLPLLGEAAGAAPAGLGSPPRPADDDRSRLAAGV
jgi:LysR family transcriptional regulator, benzoate and cis,cis-muconate-responsive activator of ben and cat genes